MQPFDHRSGNQLEVDGATLYYEETGDKNAPVLLLLHGGFGTLEEFNPVLSKLEKPFRVIGIDSRGQGRSTLGSLPLTYERLQGDVERVLAFLGVETLGIIGFSDGGIVAYRLAALTSLELDKLVTIGARWELKADDPTREIFKKITGESWRQKFPDMFSTYQALNPEPDFDLLTQSLTSMWLDSGSSGYPNEKIRDISSPTLIVRGDNDHLVPKGSVVEASERVKGSSLFNIPFAGHAAAEDQPGLFMLGLNTFLET